MRVHHGRREALVSPVRNHFFYGKMMDEAHFEIEQQYGIDMQRLVDRLALGAGVLCGLEVRATEGGDLLVSPGVAVDHQGRVIVVPAEFCFTDPASRLDEDEGWECDECGGGRRRWLTLCLRYHECLTEPVPVLVADCDTRLSCEPSLVRERFELTVRAGLPWPAGGVRHDVCRDVFPAGPPRGFDRRAAATEALDVPCGAPAGDCGVLAAVGLPVDDEGLLVDQLTYRTALHSNSELFDLLLCLADRVDGCDSGRRTGHPAITAIWPGNAEVLSREGAESAWSDWRREPRIELTFDRPMDSARLASERSWLRAWAVVPTGAPGEAQYLGMKLKFDAASSEATGCGHSRAVYLIEDPLNLVRRVKQGTLIRFLIQVRADNQDDGLRDASPVPRLLGAEFAGTGHTPDELAAIWSRDDHVLASGWTPFVAATSALPSGDGFAGGRLATWFGVDPVDLSGPPTVTAHFPRNAARVLGGEAPVVELTFDRPMHEGPAADPDPWLRAWWFERDADGVTYRRLQLSYAGPVAIPKVVTDYQSEIDSTDAEEFAFTMGFDVIEPKVAGPSGRCLVQIHPAMGPKSNDESQVVLAACFAGTRLDCDDLQAIWDLPDDDARLPDKGGFATRVWRHLTPTEARLPRAAPRPGTFHLVYSRERSR